MLKKKTEKSRPLRLTPEDLEKLVDEIVGEGLPEGIFGVPETPKFQTTKERERVAKARPSPKRALPRIEVKRPSLPEGVKDKPIANVVNVSDATIKTVAAGIDKNTAEFNSLLLTQLLPLLLSYESGTGYAQAALRDCLNVEMEFDVGLSDAVRHIGYLNVVSFFVKRSPLPASIKKHFLTVFAEQLATRSLDALVEGNKAQDRHRMAQDLQAIVYSKSSKKMTSHAPKPAEGVVKRKTK